ncbi:MAG: hypothetical protein IJ532_08340, partial [Alphaproteobacteria bacterium]|nr:hypothetical protein [Alphaproteobacteria bacterium]
YGVNHRGFSTRDELEYQVARQQREQQLIQNYNNQGITQDYPQYGTNFWGDNTDNNYGFGSSDISGNIQNVTNQLNNQGMSYNNQYSGQTPTPWSSGYQQQNPYDLQNQYNTYEDAMPNAGRNTKRLNLENELLMNGMDVLYGANRALNGMSFGGLDYLGNKFGYDTQMKDYLQLKNPQERELAQNIGQLAQIGGSALTGKALNDATKYGYNQFVRWKGRRNLTKQLQRGNNFNDIYMGKVDKDKLNALNDIRKAEGSEYIPSSSVTIPKDRVQHIYERRIINNGYTPKDAADTIYDALFNPKSQIQPSKYQTLQKFESPSSSRAIVGKIRNGDNIFVKTGYKK